MVQNVKQLPPELQGKALPGLKVLEGRNIDVSPDRAPLTQAALCSVLPNVGVITRVCSCGLQDYHSLQTTVEHRLGFNVTGNYTWPHNIDDNPGAPTLSFPNQNHHALSVDVRELQLQHLGASRSHRVLPKVPDA